MLRLFTAVYLLLMSDAVLTDEVRQLRISAAVTFYSAEEADTARERESILKSAYEKLKEIQDSYPSESAQVLIFVEDNPTTLTTDFMLERISSVALSEFKTGELRNILGRELSLFKKDENGWTDLHYAAALNLSNSAKALIVAGANVHARLEADGEPISIQLQVALEKENVVTDFTRQGYEPLHIAVMNDALEVAVLLIESGADIEVKSENGWTPLFVSAWVNALNAAVFLIEHGADIEASEWNGLTPLHVSAWRNSLEVAILLIDLGADIEAKDNKYGLTPLHVSAWENSPEVAAELLERGANFSAKTFNDETAIDIAVRRGSQEVLFVLKKYQEAS